MNRNSSFFWASDDLIRYNGVNGGGAVNGGIDGGDNGNDSDDAVDGTEVQDVVGSWPRDRRPIGVHHHHHSAAAATLWEEETEGESDEPPTIDEETAGVTWNLNNNDDNVNNNKSLDNGYNGYGAIDSENNHNRYDHRRTWSAGDAKQLRKLFERQLSSEENDLSQYIKFIRFQVVIWHVGMIDVQTGHVKMRFRLTLFWNDDGGCDNHKGSNGNNNQSVDKSFESTTATSSSSSTDRDAAESSIWVMEGRQRACRKEWNSRQRSPNNNNALSSNNNNNAGGVVREMIDVPPVSILNAVEYETAEEPEIAMVNPRTRGMRLTCMYTATLFQGDHLCVKDFPHDEHQIKLKLGILARRARGGRWDHEVYRLGLAREEDSLGSTRIPHGLVVEHCHIPDFSFDPSDLDFRFLPLADGGRRHLERERDAYLQVTLPCHRQSGHYDSSILPILFMLNIIAISCIVRNFGSSSAATEIMLSIAFVQVGIRLTLDSRLPSVGYQIKMQAVMNGCFWLLCGLVLESNLVFFLVKKRGWEIADTDRIDLAAGCVALMYNFHITITYFRGRRRHKENKTRLSNAREMWGFATN